MLESITHSSIQWSLIDNPLLLQIEQMKEAQLAFGIQVARWGDIQLMEEYYKAFGVNKQQLIAHPDYHKFLTNL